MANQEQLDRLRIQGARMWNQWRSRNPDVQIDLRSPGVRVRGHGVPDTPRFEHGQAHDKLRAVAHAGDDKLKDRPFVRFLEAAALQRIGFRNG